MPAEVTDEVRQVWRDSFVELFGKGLAAVSCRRRSDGTAVYDFGPVDDD
jgi:hypothetical protein